MFQKFSNRLKIETIKNGLESVYFEWIPKNDQVDMLKVWVEFAISIYRYDYVVKLMIRIVNKKQGVIN